MVSAILSRLVILVFGTLYPAYASYKAVRTKNVKEYVKWMMYWIVFALFCAVETFSDVLLSWFPFYYEFKIVFVLWLLSPITQGSSFLFRKFVHPQLARREKDIDELIEQTIKQGYSTFFDLGNKGIKVILNSVITGQSKLVDHLRHSYSTSDLANDGHDIIPRRDAAGDHEEEKDYELDNRLIEDQAELIASSTSSITKSRSSSSALSLSSVKEEDGEESEQVVTKTFTIPSTTRRHYTAREDTAKRQLRCQSLPPFSDKSTKPTVIAHTSVESKRQYHTKFQAVEQKTVTANVSSEQGVRFMPKGHVLTRSLSHDSASARWLSAVSPSTTKPGTKISKTAITRNTEGSTYIKSDISKKSTSKIASQPSLSKMVSSQEKITTEIKQDGKDMKQNLQDVTETIVEAVSETPQMAPNIKSVNMLGIGRSKEESASKILSQPSSEIVSSQENTDTEMKQDGKDFEPDFRDTTGKNVEAVIETQKMAPNIKLVNMLEIASSKEESASKILLQPSSEMVPDLQDTTKKTVEAVSETQLVTPVVQLKIVSPKEESVSKMVSQPSSQQNSEAEIKQDVKDIETDLQDAKNKAISEKIKIEIKQDVKDIEPDFQDATNKAISETQKEAPSIPSNVPEITTQQAIQTENIEDYKIVSLNEDSIDNKEESNFSLLTVGNLGDNASSLIFVNIDNDSDDQCSTPRANDSPENLSPHEENHVEKEDPMKEVYDDSVTKESDTSSDVEFGSLDQLDIEASSEGSCSSLWETMSEASSPDVTKGDIEETQVASTKAEDPGPWSAPGSPASFIRGSKYEEEEIDSWSTPSLLMSPRSERKDTSSSLRPELQKQKSFPSAASRSILHSWPSPSQFSGSSSTSQTRSSLSSSLHGSSFDPFQTWHPRSRPGSASHPSLGTTSPSLLLQRTLSSSPKSLLQRTLSSHLDTSRRLYSRSGSLDVAGGESLYRQYHESAYRTNPASSQSYLSSSLLSTRRLASSRTHHYPAKSYRSYSAKK